MENQILSRGPSIELASQMNTYNNSLTRANREALEKY